MELPRPLRIFVSKSAAQGVMKHRGQEAWEKAAACEAHAQGTADGKLQVMFRKLRDSWIRIGNDAQFSDDVAANAQRMEKREAG
jgi:hypothetical protein